MYMLSDTIEIPILINNNNRMMFPLEYLTELIREIANLSAIINENVHFLLI